MRNLRYALRQLVRRPGLSVVVIVMLALGIGATTAMFSWVHTVLLQPLPVAEPEHLVNLSAPGPKPGSNSCSFAGDCGQVFSYPMFRDLEAGQTVFTGMAGHRVFRANLAIEGRAVAGAGALVSGGYFGVLGLEPEVGRLIVPADEPRVGESAVAVLSHDYWRTAFATLLAAIGLYGVLAYGVAQRTREFGVRLALGATPTRLRGMVLRQVGWMALIGLPAGLVAAVAVSRARGTHGGAALRIGWGRG